MERYSTGSPFEAEIAYCRAVACDGWIFVAGTTGYDYATMTLPGDVESQCGNALANVEGALAAFGAGFSDVVRVRYILPERADWPPCWPLLRAAFAGTPPAATMIVAPLQEPAMRFEIEVTARQPGGGA